MPAQSKGPVSTRPTKSNKKLIKKSGKKELSPEARIARHFRTLYTQVDGAHFLNALKTCDKILKLDSKDEDALQAKLFLLLQTEQYEAALSLIDSFDNSSHKFEKAYALYRLQRETEAAELLSEVNQIQNTDEFYHRGVMHLEAQVAYRQGAYQEAFDHYTQLLDSSTADSEEHADLETNLNASQVHLDFLTSGYLQALDLIPITISNNLEAIAPPAPPGSNVIPMTTLNTASSAIPSANQGEKKVRIKRVPKGVIPGVTPPPDPERWIKKSERSGSGQGSGRRKKVGGGSTQGSTMEPTSSHAPKSSAGKSKKKK